MKHYDMIRFFNSLKGITYTEKEVTWHLNKFQSTMTEKKLFRLRDALDKYINKEELKIKSKYSEKDLIKKLEDYKTRTGLNPMRGGLGGSTNPKARKVNSPINNSLNIDLRVLIYNDKLFTIYKLRNVLQGFPSNKLRKPYKKFQEYFETNFTEEQISLLTSSLNSNSKLNELAIIISALFQNEVIQITSDSLLNLLKALCDYVQVPYKKSFESNIYDYLNDKNPKGYIYKDQFDPLYIYYEKKIFEIFF